MLTTSCLSQSKCLDLGTKEGEFFIDLYHVAFDKFRDLLGINLRLWILKHSKIVNSYLEFIQNLHGLSC